MKTDFILTKEILNVERVSQFLEADHIGAQVIFVGTVRDTTKGKRVVALDFESYDEMAIKELEKIASEITSRWPVCKIALHHAIGRREVGGVPVIAGICSAHRKEAFEACEYLMNRLKESVPIWKKEIFEDGEEWVSNTP